MVHRKFSAVQIYKEVKSMSNNVPEAKAYLEQLKMEVANEQGINLKQGYNGDLTARQNGTVGGYMVKKMIEQAQGLK